MFYLCLYVLFSFNTDTDSSSDSEIEDVDRFATQARTDPAIGFRGFSRNQDGIMKTKHDAEMCGRRHACKVMELTSSIATGDGSGFDMKLNNSVYNSLRGAIHSDDLRLLVFLAIIRFW